MNTPHPPTVSLPGANPTPHSSPAPQAEGPVCAIDIGGTSLKWMVVAPNGEVIDSGTQASQVQAIREQTTDLCRHVCATHPHVVAFGVSTPGIVDEASGTIVFASNLNLAGVRLAEAITDATGLPASVGHDGRNAGIAEGLLGAGRGASSFMMIPIGTGISAAIYSNQEMIAGHQFSAGEIGHAPIVIDGEPCTCGQRGCLEVYASAKGIARRYAARTGHDIGTRAIERVLDHDPVAAQVWDDAVRMMAVALTQQILTLDPQRIIIGGGLSKAGDVYMEPLRQRIADLLAWREAPQIVTAQLGDAAGRWGAAILANRTVGRHDYKRWVA